LAGLENCGGAETYGIKPDVIILAKALGNGWPISAVVASGQIGDAFEPGDHFSTWELTQ
jgi:acetylornithine/succinyldiaminopimelate/putrescine aminotransferase